MLLYVSFSDSTGVISDLPESESTVTASVTVSNNSSRASSVVLWVGKFVDDVLTDVTYQQQEVAGNAQDVTISASLDGVKKDLATAADGSSYDRTVLKAFVWTALVGGKALAPVASLPSDNLDVVAVKKDGDVWKDFNSATTNYDLTITKTDPIPEFEFIVADNSTKVEMPDAFVIGSNTVKLTSAAGTEKEYTINLIDGFTNDGIFFDDFQSYNGVMDAHIWTNASGYLKNMTLVEEDDGNAYVSIFGTADQQWPRLDTVVTGLDLGNVIEISGKAMLQNSASHNSSMTVQFRRSLQAQVSVLGISDSSVSLFGQSFGGGVEMNTWFDFKLSVTYDEGTKNATVTATVTGDGVNGETLTSTRTGSLSSLNLNNDLPLMFNTGLDKEGTSSVNLDDIKVAYGPSADTTLQTLQYSAEGVTYDVADFVPGAAAPADGYRIYVPVGTTSVTLKGVPTIAQGAKAEVYVDGALSADNSVAVAGQETAATVRVTAEDGTTTADYPITIVIGDAVASTNIKLASLTYTIDGEEPATVSGFTPADEGGSYNVILPNGTTSVTLATAPANANATYTMALADGTPVENGVVDVTNGATVVITVTPEDTGAAQGVFTINFAIDQGMYVLDENNGAVQSENSGIEFTTAVLESGSATYDYADGFVIGGVGSSGNRNSDYVLNGDGKNLGYTWTLSSDEYMPGTYKVYIKGSGYGSGGQDSFYFVYDEAACSPDSGLVFKAPSQANAPIAEQDMVALNWVAGDNTITIPEDGSATLRILGREGGAFVDKVILIDMNVAKTIEEAEAELSPLYDAVFTSEGGDTLATVKYGSDVVGTAVPTEGTYLDEDSIPATGTIDALVVPEKEGFAGSWSPAVLQDGGTTFVPVYEEPVDLIFEDDFEGYGDLTVPDNSKWDGIYKFNTLLKKDGSNTYASLFPAIREDLTPPSFERYPRLSESFAFDATKGALRFSGRVMLQDNIAKTEFGLHLLGTGNSRGYPMSLSASQIKVFGVEESFGQMPTGNWVDFTYYLTYDSNSKNAEGLMILEGEGLTDAFGNTTNRIVAAGATDLSAVGISDKLTMYLNTSFSAEDSGASVNLDNIKVGYASVPALSDNATLSSLTYAVDGGTAETVPGFSATDEGGDYAAIELPYGTTEVTVGATRADDNASVTISPENPIAVSSAAETVVTVTVTNGNTTNTFKLTFTVAAQEPQPTEEIFSDDFEAYGLDTALDKATKGWDAVNQTANFTAVTNPDGSGQVAEVKSWGKELYPSLRKNVPMQAGETYAISGKARVHDGEQKPNHYLEFRSSRPNPDYDPSDENSSQTITATATTFRVSSSVISLPEGNVIGYMPSEEAWISYTLYITPSATGVELVAEVTGEGLKDANGNDTDKIVAGKTLNTQELVPSAGDRTVTVIFNNGMGAESDARIYLDDLVIREGATAPTLSSDTNLSSLKYAPNGSNATDVPGFAEDKTDYGTIELPYGTTSVTVTAVTKDANARASVKVGEDEMAGGVVTVSPDAATDVVVVVTAQDGTTKNITMSFTVSDEEEPEPTEIISNLTYATSDTPTLTQIERGVTESYTNADGCVITTASSAEFEGAYVLQRNKGGDTTGPNWEAEPNYIGAFDGQNGNPYWMTFTMNVAGTVYVVDMEGKGWPNRGDWLVDTTGLTFGIWEMTINGSSGRLFSKHFNAGDTVYMPNYGWKDEWKDETVKDGRVFTNPSIYLIVPDSDLTKSASLKSLTYTVGDGSAVTVPDFVSGSTETNTFDVTIADMSAAVKVAAEGITNANASISYSSNVAADGTVTFEGNTAQVVVTVKSADESVTNTYTINFTRNVDPMAGAKTYDVPSHDGTTIDILVNPELTALRSNSGNNEIKPTEPIGNLSKFYGDRNDTGTDGKTPGMAFTDVGAAIMGATQLINPIGDTPGRAKDEDLKAFTGADNEYFRFRANEAGTVYVKFDSDIASYEADPSWTKVVEPSNGLDGMGDWGANGLPEEYVHNYMQYPYYCNMYQNASADKIPTNYATRYTVTYYKTFAADEIVTIRTINSTNNQNLITLIQWGEDVPSYNTALASLTYNGISVPNFSADTKDYTIYMPTADAVSIAAVAADSGMDVSYSKQSLTPSAAGDTATITVSNGGGTQTVYTVKAILDTTANKVLNLSSASRADVQENLVIGASDGTGGSLAYIDRDNVLYTDGTSTFFEGATYIRSAKDDGNAVYSTKPYFSETYNGKDGNPYWLEFIVTSDCRIFFADTYYNADLTNPDPGMQEFAQPWPNKPEGWITAAPTDDVDIVSTHFQARTENGSVYYKDFKAGDVVQIPNYGAPSYWADDRAPWDPPVYLIVWGDDIQNPGIDDGGEPGGDTGDEGGIEEGGQDPNPWQ